MSEIEAVAAALGAAVTALEQAEQAMQKAAEGFGESASHLGQAVYGTSDPEIGALPGLYDELGRSAEQAVSHFGTAKASISAYLEKIGASTKPANVEVKESKREDRPRVRPGVHTTSPEGGLSDDERAQALRADLPPPVTERGQKTHGRWFANGSGEPAKEIVSGKHEPDPDDPDDVSYEAAQAHLTKLGYNRLAIASHVETRLAVRMARTSLRDVTVTLNHVPCPGPFGCDTVMPSVLPPGATLTVHGVKADGTPVVNRYTGASE
ncbi:DddA-like double-stranded DNA deaminase toxin [Amycolatopsis sp. NPDC051071]|uniref:DddA-like double-stranded DNA deaminase toxin n=1 Tax=Amycolatopsis sp. NPDC051071 TaxID=3154637 RepID=UPI0034240CCA